MTRGRVLLVTLSLLLCLLCAGGLLAWQAWSFLSSAPESPGREARVDVAPGAGLARIAQALEARGVVTDARKFALLARWKGAGSSLQAGRFLLRTDWTPERVLDALVNGRPELSRLTIPEGLTLLQTVRLLAEGGYAPEEELLATLRDPDFLRHYGIPFPSAEGFLMPDTYLLKTPGPESGKDPRRSWKLAGRLVDNFWLKSGPLWPEGRRLSGEALKRAVILASIVEKETALPEERPRVAGVYANRLARGMLLQADPTVIYGLGPSYGGRLTRAMLEDESNPYNTYRRAGLPPGPICSFGISALRAALSPERHDFLYFVAVEDGGAHAFSRSLAEHNRAVKSYLERKRKRADAR